jgi:murein DD-endopeptidase MepM/ murein hydrolase activator NlpD
VTDIAARPSPVRFRTGAERALRYVRRGPDLAAEFVAPLTDTLDADDFVEPRVNFRWLAGAVLTALAGILLIGSAVTVTLDHSVSVLEDPPLAHNLSNSREETETNGGMKGDRLVTFSDIASARQTFKAPTPVTVGDHEVIKIRPYVRVATNLALSSIGFSNDVPNFEPMKLFGGPELDASTKLEIRTSDNDTDVALQKIPLTGVKLPSTEMIGLDADTIESQVEEARKAALALGKAMPLTFGGQQFLARTLPTLTGTAPGQAPSLDTSFSSIEISVVPENVTSLAKKPPVQSAPRATTDERMASLRRADDMAKTIAANGAPLAAAKDAVAIIKKDIKDTPLKDNMRLRILLALPANPKMDARLMRVMLYDGDVVLAIAAVDDSGQFVSVAPPSAEGTISADEQTDEEQDTSGGFRLYNSLYETALKNDIPKTIIDQLVRVFFYDVDLQRKVAGGDSFEVFYAEDDEVAGQYELLYAALSVSGITKRYYEFKSPADNSVDYFDPLGKSNRQFLMRKPISEGIFRSGFGMRYHPILHVSRLHSGVDWANKIGTPILAAGDGVISFADWDSGYGRHIEIQHAYDFTTTYSHMSAFAKGIAEGVHVKQGQVIGYLGNSGLATGPHLHYEVLVDGEFKDPMAIKLPRGRELTDQELKIFKTQQDAINDVMAKAPGSVRPVSKATP